MLLSELIYLAVKNVVYYDDDAFTYDSFKKGVWKNSADYGNQINNILTPINEAISRLNDLDRIPYQIEKITINSEIIEFSKLSKQVKEIVGIGTFIYREPFSVEYFQYAHNSVIINSTIYSDYDVFVEYKPVISFWKYDGSNDIDLFKVYGIDDNMCQYIIEYAEGKLYEQISPTEANMHITRSEQYFSNIRSQKATFQQRVVEPIYRMDY